MTPYLGHVAEEIAHLDLLTELLRIEDVAARLKVSTRTVRRLIANRRLQAVRDGGIVRIPVASLLDYLARRLEPAAEEEESAAPTEAGRPRTSRVGGGGHRFSFGPLDPDRTL